MITEKRFKVAVYDDKAINGFAVLDLQKPNSSKRLKYENVYIGSKVGCEIVCNFGNSLADENEQLRKENYELHKRLGDFESFEEHIKERTSKTSVNDIVGLVKTNEPTDTVELKRTMEYSPNMRRR